MLLTFCTVKLCRLHHEENLRVSMAKERKRLLNEDLVSEVPVHATYPNSGGEHRRRSRGISSSRSHRGGIGINLSDLTGKKPKSEFIPAKTPRRFGGIEMRLRSIQIGVFPHI